MRLFLAMAAAGACVFLGWRSQRRLLTREETLGAWAAAFSRMEGAVLHTGDSLPELMRRGGGERIRALKELADRIGETPAAPVEELLRDLAWDESLTEEEKETGLECLSGLFSSTRDQQARALRDAREAWRRYVLSAREARERNGKMYLSLGWLAGAALFILIC